MHELSLARSILDIARRSLPCGAALRSVRVVAGPMRAIDPDAMNFAWRSVTGETGFDNVELELDVRPWTLRCPECGDQWTSPQLDGVCPTCGGSRAFPIGGDELQVISIEVDEEDATKGAASCAAYPSSRT